MTITAKNFHIASTAIFSKCDKPSRPADLEFKGSGPLGTGVSRYWVEKNRVIRESNHWGSKIKSCDWYLEGDYPMSCDADDNGMRTGVCEYKDMVHGHNSSFRQQIRSLKKDKVVLYSKESVDDAITTRAAIHVITGLKKAPDQAAAFEKFMKSSAKEKIKAKVSSMADFGKRGVGTDLISATKATTESVAMKVTEEQNQLSWVGIMKQFVEGATDEFKASLDTIKHMESRYETH